MMMQAFDSKFPEVADKEMRCVIISDGNDLPAGEYFMIESYCNDKPCDCRRVFINILHKKDILATIGYGWEDLKFYKNWIHDDDLAEDVKGPILELGGICTKYSNDLLTLFKEVMLNDKVFIERLKRHYKMFKQSLR